MSRHFGDTSQIQSCVSRWLAGEGSARDELLVGIQRRLYQLARKMLQGFPAVLRQVEADDVVMEVNRRLLRALNSGVRPPSVADLMRLAAWHIRRQLLDWAKKYRHEKPSPNGSYLPIDRPDPTDGPATLVDWAEFHEAIKKKLVPEHRKYFALIYYLGLTVKEAATVLGQSETMGKRGWRDARFALRRLLHR